MEKKLWSLYPLTFLAICFNDLWLWTPLSQLTYLLHNSCHSFVPFFVLLRMKTLKFPQFELLEFIRILGGKSLVVIYGFTTLTKTKICVKFICSLLRKITFPTLLKSSFFVQKFNFDFPKKLSIFLGEKLVKMLWFWTF